MNDSQRHRADLDAAIDRAVRDLLSAEPRAGMRQRVLDRLNARPMRMLTLPRLAAVSALAVIILVVTVILRRPPVPETQFAGTQTVSPAVQPPAPSVTGAPAAVPPAPPVAPNRRRPQTVPRSAPATRMAGGGGASNRPDRRVEAASIPPALALEPEATSSNRLAPVVPIGVAAIDMPEIATPQIGVKPLTIEPIAIAPMTRPR